MNETVNSFSLGGDKFLPEIHLGQPGFTYSKFIYINRRFMIYLENELHKACFQHDMAYGDFKDLTRRTDADKVIHVKAFNIAKNPKYDVYQRGISYIWFMSNKELEEELHQPVIRTF